MQIKIDPSITQILKKAEGMELKDILIRLRPEGLIIKQANRTKQRYVNLFISNKSSYFKDYQVESEELLPIVDFPIFIKIIESFDELITLIKNTHLFLKTEKREVQYTLVVPDYIEYTDTPENVRSFEKEENLLFSFNIPSDVLEQSINDALIFDSKFITFEFSPKSIKIIASAPAGSENKIINYLDLEPININLEVHYETKQIMEVIKKLSLDMVTFAMFFIPEKKDTYILSLIEETDDYFIKNYLVNYLPFV